jgi:hypothetical protein
MKEIPLTRGQFALVDDEDFEYLNQWKWITTDNGYARRTEYKNGTQKPVNMHVLIASPSLGMLVDHINGNKLDNRRENLRICTNTENRRNISKYKNNTSGYKGVTWHKQHRKWYAQIVPLRKNIFLGLFSDAKEAARAYDAAAKKYFGQFARLNFPKE